jgi:hypothetical protein
MGDGLSATIGAGDEVGGVALPRHSSGFGLGRAADKTRALGPAAGLAKHGACPNVGSNSSPCHRQIVRFSRVSQRLRSQRLSAAARKKVFL